MAEPMTSYPQPHEGVAGVERTEDDLLSLDDKAVSRRLLMAGMAQATYRATLVGNPAPSVAQMWARMKEPRPGDLVMETTSRFRGDPDTTIKGFGILVVHREEWASTDQDWAAEVAREPGIDPIRDRFHEDAWYVQYGPQPEDVCRWENCDFVSVPIGHDWADL